MPSIDTAVFQLSALALLGLILIVAVIALFRLGSLKRALAERPSTTAVDVVPFAKPEERPAEAQEEPPREERPAEAHEEPEREPAPSPQEESAGPEAQEPSRPGPEPEAGVEQPDSEAPGLVPDAGGREAELQPEPVAEEAAREEAEPAAAAAGAYWPKEETRPAATIREEELEAEPVGVGEDGPRDLVEGTGGAGAPAAEHPPAREAEAPAEAVATPSTVSAQQQQVAEGESEFAAERTWDDLSEQAETPANDEPSRSEPEGVLGAAWAYDWAREMPEEQPIEREGRWWFKRGGELLLYDETTAQWVPAPMPEARSGNEPAGNSNGVEFGGAAAATQASFWKCPSCGAVNGSTASTCRMCFAARP